VLRDKVHERFRAAPIGDRRTHDDLLRAYDAVTRPK
jgi:hypothetical protein